MIDQVEHYVLAPLGFVILISMFVVLAAVATLLVFVATNKLRRQESLEILAELGFWRTLRRLLLEPEELKHSPARKTGEIAPSAV